MTYPRPIASLLVAAVTAAALTTAGSARASVTVVSGGSAAPAATLGPYTMTPFPKDTVNPADTSTTSIPTPLGSPITLGSSLNHTTVGDEWGTWSNGYTGDVYADYGLTASAATTAAVAPVDPTDTLTLPPQTGAFYLYFEPEQFATFAMTVTASDGTTATQQVSGSSGAAYYGFYATPGQSLDTLTIDSGDPDGYAIGEFGITHSTAVPEPASLGLAASAAVGLLGRRRRTIAAR